ncbi:diadenosine tetraphosphate hydrolase [Candidatus Parcubacteria bacterium]|nr:diadenosine tetraphosphate hydrolase [Candidatus Parcubacteria bacterium]
MINESTKKRNIINFRGQSKKIACLGCARAKGEISVGDILKSKYFDAHQDYEIPIPGFVIISSKRHIQSVDEFTEAEQQDFIKFLCRLRQGIRKMLKISVVYLIQEEDTSHHFHVWVFPRYSWMQKQFGRKIESVRPIMEYAKKNLKTKNNLKKVDSATQKLKIFFEQ